MMTIKRIPEIEDLGPHNYKYIWSSTPALRYVTQLISAEEIFSKPDVDDAIHRIDGNKTIAPGVYQSDALGLISWEQISGGAKGCALITVAGDPRVGKFNWEFNSGIWGDNCLPVLAEFSHHYDFTVIPQHTFDFARYRDLNFSACTADGIPLKSLRDLVNYWILGRILK